MKLLNDDYLEWDTQFSHRSVHQLLDPFLIFVVLKFAHTADHATIGFDPKQAFQEFSFSSNTLMDPSKHVSDVTHGVMRM